MTARKRPSRPPSTRRAQPQPADLAPRRRPLAAVWALARRHAFALALVAVVLTGAAVGFTQGRSSEVPAPAPTAPPPQPTTDAQAAAPAPKSARELFGHACGACHVLRAAGVDPIVGVDLDRVRPRLTAARVRQQIRTGTLDSAMPAGLLQGRDAERVSRYVARVAGRRG